MDGFVLEALSSTGWKLSGDTFWTLDTAKARAVRLLKGNHAKRVRVLPVSISDSPVSELPDSPEPAYITEFRRIAAAESTLPHVREAITAALAAYDARRAER